MLSVQASSEPFKLYLLLGEPRDEALRPAYEKAVKNLRNLPVENELVFEAGATEFTNCLAEQMEEHAAEEEGTEKAAAEETVVEETVVTGW
ncbi:hypothetical protein [Prosthecobacter sp.]|jgi:hypothetical protein|uniref:hypothetical protein n=1 Tax=Prosthecobacter sp. TaxID=1965333 RepID=UPI0037C73308